MRSRDPESALRDALDAAGMAAAFCEGVSLDGFGRDEVIRAAPERKLELVGEALSRAERADSSIGDSIRDLRRIVGLRNVLAHGYDVVDPAEIYLIVTTSVPDLIVTLRAMLRAEDTE